MKNLLKEENWKDDVARDQAAEFARGADEDEEANERTKRVWAAKPLSKMTPEEAYQHGQDLAKLQGVTPNLEMFKNPHFHAGFHNELNPKKGTHGDDWMYDPPVNPEHYW
jgi:hypothetical protein